MPLFQQPTPLEMMIVKHHQQSRHRHFHRTHHRRTDRLHAFQQAMVTLPGREQIPESLVVATIYYIGALAKSRCARKESRKRNILAVVKNIGNANSKAASLVFYVKQKGRKTYQIPPLSPGGSHTIKRRYSWGTAVYR